MYYFILHFNIPYISTKLGEYDVNIWTTEIRAKLKHRTFITFKTELSTEKYATWFIKEVFWQS